MAEATALRLDGYKQMRARICATFGGYRFEDVDGLCRDEFAEVAGAVLWLSEQEHRAAQKTRRKGTARW